VIQGDFHRIVGAEAIRTSGHHSDFPISILMTPKAVLITASPDMTLRTLRKRRFQTAVVLGVLCFGTFFLGGWALEGARWVAYTVFAFVATGVLIWLELRLARVCCPDCGRRLKPKAGGTDSQYQCPKCGLVWDIAWPKRAAMAPVMAHPDRSGS